MSVIVKLHSYGCLIHIFTGEDIDGTPKIFTDSQYNSWFKSLGYQFSPVLISNTHDNFHFLNKFKLKIPRFGKIDPKIINRNDFYYKCSKYGPDLLFGTLKIRNKRDEPFTPRKKLLFLINNI